MVKEEVHVFRLNNQNLQNNMKTYTERSVLCYFYVASFICYFMLSCVLSTS